MYTIRNGRVYYKSIFKEQLLKCKKKKILMETSKMNGLLNILELEDLLDDAVGADAELLEQDHRGSGARNLTNAHLAKNQISRL